MCIMDTDVYEVLGDAGIDVYPSAGHTHRAEGGYPPNSHDCMPCELVNNKFKEITRKNFNKLQKSRQNMNSLFSQIHKTAEQFPVDFVRDRIACLPKIMSAIIAKDGGRTKY